MQPIALKTGEVSGQESLLFQGGDPAKFREIGCLAYALRMDREIVLVDTGINDLAVVNRTVRGPNHWRRGEHETIEAQLARRGIDRSEVTWVILTHLHYDHCSNLMKFPRATVVLTGREWEYAHSGAVAASPMRQAILPVLEYLDSLPLDRVVFIDREHQLLPGLNLRPVGGHTPGSLMVEAALGAQNYLCTGDAVFLRDNVRLQVPIGFSAEPLKSASVLGDLGGYGGTLLTGHDLTCLQTLGD